ncbi:hypothetical protein ABT275_40800 [Streptomyces sp. NPDC001185]|uniref:hypothetical protein n=1 Tax=Streptomyces sp. NPDC001185 TaxID=3154380 RepID=UPI003329FF98
MTTPPHAAGAAPLSKVRLQTDLPKARFYFLQGDGHVAAQPYALIAKALARNTKVAIAKLPWIVRERLVLLRSRTEFWSATC